jgi:cytochrome b subunit of formate dehydrogenase
VVFARQELKGLFGRAAIAAGALLFALAAEAAEELGTDTCLTCHGESGFADAAGRSLFIDPGMFQLSAHGVLSCTTCHADVTELPHAEHLQPVRIDTVCANCHDEAVGAYRQSVHGRGDAAGAQAVAGCENCHGAVHALKPHTDAESAVHWSKLAATCARCHGSAEGAETARMPTVRPVEAYLASVHGRLVAAGERAAVCSDCHGAHEIAPATDPNAPTARPHVSTTCGRCHGEILARYRDSVHGEALARGDRSVPVCTDCHGEHSILSTGDPDSPVFATNVPTETCGRCHADERLSRKYGFRIGNVASFRDSFHGLALRAGQVRVANCASCHGVHDIRPSRDPRSHVNPANLAETCGKCHPGAGTRFALGSVHGNSDSIGTQGVAWVRWIYLWVIGVAVGFMALHNALDLARKGRPAPQPKLADHPVRMTRTLRWQHGLVMLSFPVLAYSGFALTYPESWWAAPFLRWEVGLGARGLVHRAAALVLVGALGWHIAQLARSSALRACLAGLWPSWRDAAALLRSLAYYLHLRSSPPHGGKFSYIEKIEYWAFLWGTVLMALTGGLLWFENLSLHLLPAWVLEIATAIHFYEAILAILSILVWHLYWVIFDPHVYPMDWSWWTGRSPASRVQERQENESEPTD